MAMHTLRPPGCSSPGVRMTFMAREPYGRRRGGESGKVGKWVKRVTRPIQNAGGVPDGSRGLSESASDTPGHNAKRIAPRRGCQNLPTFMRAALGGDGVLQIGNPKSSIDNQQSAASLHP